MYSKLFQTSRGEILNVLFLKITQVFQMPWRNSKLRSSNLNTRGYHFLSSIIFVLLLLDLELIVFLSFLLYIYIFFFQIELGREV
jgi:hypothetical protein